MIAATHTLIISSRCVDHISDQVVKAIREVVYVRGMGVGVDRVRKARNQKVVLTCAPDDATKRVETLIKIKAKDLQVETKRARHRRSRLEKVEARVCYRRRARNPLECHPVLEVSPALHMRLIKAGFVYVELQRRPVWDQSPLVQCSRCLGFGHSRKFCRKQNDKYAHCGATKQVSCAKAAKPVNLRSASIALEPATKTSFIRHLARNAASEPLGCYSADQSRVLLARSKLATAELLIGASRRKIAVALVQESYLGNTGVLKRYSGCRVIQRMDPRAGPVNAAILILDSDVDVEEDQTPIDENVTAAVITAGSCRIGVGLLRGRQADRLIPRPREVGLLETRYEQNHPGGRRQRMERVVGHIQGGDRLFQSAVDVTACSSALLDRAEEWQVVREVISSDHNVVTYNIRTGGRSGPGPFRSTRIYNTAKARWLEFLTAFGSAKEERALTDEMVETVDLCDRLDEVVDLYTECVQHAYDTAISRKRSVRRLKLPWWSPKLEGLKKDANAKKWCFRNAAPSRRRYVVEEYVRANEVYERAAADVQTTSWKRFSTARDRESIWDGVYRVIRDTEKNREDVLLINDSEQTCSPYESAVLLANTFFPDDSVDTDDPYRTEVRRQTDGSVCLPARRLQISSPGWTRLSLGQKKKCPSRLLIPRRPLGLTGLCQDICQTAILQDLGLFLAMANKCLQLGYFPRAWKVAAIKVISKPGKDDYSRPKSYRPIGLLPVMGKTVERMLVWRIQWHIMSKLQTRQYDFMPKRGTEDSLYDLMTHIHNELNRKRIVVTVSFVIERAFDNAWWPAIRNQRLAHKCPMNFRGMVMGYLRDREVVDTPEGSSGRGL
ncbi:Retrovirus-related Pol polyprotein from type-1 retrotransposable element R1 [Eumeta japonica]|uniref:Retrovirus-related Pol polyprotein from type-1 retrotransposable element R1 n=1 Tax=Eumeta variegata TaxID=151549 RepID=A0A4C1V4A1_EUMVA|nr:Retrovirus-related Pol polyprotein from type-1 retrotransposable element R1 [Eumeta japonica]